MYADLADFEPEAAAQSAKPGAGQQPIRKPQQHQSNDYASITDVLKTGEGGEAEKVPISRPATCFGASCETQGRKTSLRWPAVHKTSDKRMLLGTV